MNHLESKKLGNFIKVKHGYAFKGKNITNEVTDYILVRDHANVSQLVCLANLENLNAVMIQDKLPQKERLLKLNQIAISQMKILLQHNSPKLFDNHNGEDDE